MENSKYVFVYPCGADQQGSGRHEPDDLYTGTMFDRRRKAVEALRAVHGGPAFILSTRHGLIRPRGDVYAPYDAPQRETEAGKVRAQAERYGVLGARVVAVASIHDIAFLREVFGQAGVVDMCRAVGPDLPEEKRSKALAVAAYITNNPDHCARYFAARPVL